MSEPTAYPEPWSAVQIDGVWFVVRNGMWQAQVRITPSEHGDIEKEDKSRAERVCATLNRIAR